MGQVRLAIPHSELGGLPGAGVSEIRHYGRTSAHTCRRLRALLVDLEDSVLPGYRPAVRRQLAILDKTSQRLFRTPPSAHIALREDRSGNRRASNPHAAAMPAVDRRLLSQAYPRTSLPRRGVALGW